jgi:hypothetical protein
MQQPFPPRIPSPISLAIVSMLLLPGCSCSPPKPDMTAYGTVETNDDRPFTLTGPKQTLKISHGAMRITPAYGFALFRADSCPNSLIIETRGQTMEIPLNRGTLSNDQINIFGAAHGLSANIRGSSHLVSMGQPHDRSTSESCTTSGYCSKQVTKEECHDGKCEKKTVSESGYHSDCPGTRPVTIHLDWVKTSYRIDFVNPMNTSQRFATFDGLTGEWEHETGKDTGSCSAS